MARVRKPDAAILELRALYAALANILHADDHCQQNMAGIRSRTLAEMKAAYELGCTAIRQRFAADGNARKAIADATLLIDHLLTVLFQFAGRHVLREHGSQLKNHLTVVGVGGYGRGELFPYSDVDLLFLHAEGELESTRHIAEFMLYMLWDMGLQVGQSVRSVEEAITIAREDVTVRTNLLDARLICGNPKLLKLLDKRYWEEVATEQSAQEFVEAKLAERDARHARCGDSRYVLEPNIKDGKGGLRDLQTLYWLARYVYRVKSVSELVKRGVLNASEYRSHQRAQEFLWLVRTHLHLAANRPEERLTFEMQRLIAEKMGYQDRGSTQAVERFMKSYFLNAKTIGSLTRIFCANMEEEHKRKRRFPMMSLLLGQRKLQGFIVDGERINVPHDTFFKEHPPRVLALFAVAQQQELDIHPHALRLISRQLSLVDANMRADKEANQLFMEILTYPRQPEVTLRRMNEAGVLGRFIPDFGRVVGQMQFDMYHVYTVDEHSIFAISILNQIEQGKLKEEFPLASEVIHKIGSRRVLLLALFCHDIAKGRGGDHSVLGERVVRKLARRFGFEPQEEENAAWLVRQHLLFSHTAFKRDIAEEKTVADFVEAVQSPERLRLLLVLTVADIRAVGPKVWNSWKGALMRDLYHRAEKRMGAGTGVRGPMGEEALAKAIHELRPALTDARCKAYVTLTNQAMRSVLDVPTHARITRLLDASGWDDTRLALELEPDPARSITELLLIAPDRKGLFAAICGVLAVESADIMNAKLFQLSNGLSVEWFFIQNLQKEAYARPDKLKRLREALSSLILTDLGKPLVMPQFSPSGKRKSAFFRVAPRVIVENSASSHHTVIEVNGHDRLGFLSTVTRTLADLELTVSAAHISSYGERAVDVFYVKDKYGMKLLSEARIRQVRERLMEALMPDVVAFETRPPLAAR